MKKKHCTFLPTASMGSRPAQIDERLTHRIIYAFLNEEFITTTQSERQLCGEGFAVKAPAIRTLLKASGFTCTLEPPPKQRLEFARNYINFTVDDWKCVVFSDECKGKTFPVRAGGHVMVWGCFSPRGHGELVKVNETMTSPKHVDVLEPTSSMKELWTRFRNEWDSIPEEMGQNLIASMQSRMHKCILKKGYLIAEK
ncbi:hypothetical protein PHYBLDRAFT_144355 [Phycomyces blakesleeanus NRRL 1555(-)]|uniref:Homeodomain-like DNA binding domain-containing transcription factor n=1 Tax=Phycomyces blakesleeanus (strain ATCC 8743b / DSM 1359 / FGSC 10004 / NBRC 33097 / NRRL 1555) TaxID=763407 RepID=A0A162UGE2_PHYB8|nr:hypothetical protein PHYBLDRAFT_144355 [Phycomyces blakesleeanus NRRL 1555(-)]OAD75003.1 hypothetical protein PHYBLDRAFT_144355 [Phycomyces blakesleeanus NRRL 1555(-)]|eukprot:XP_018293043.1 hypothetical protein PHYBLDRAFT_144355 [Phycomyces blakesleeanus NRRL 1555(-)]